MHDPAILRDLALVVILGAAVALLLARLRFPTTAGLLLAGALVGPTGLRLVGSSEVIGTVAEVGVVLLLFTIGLEFSLTRLRHIGRAAALGGLLQVGLTAAAFLLLARLFGADWGRAILYGFIFALSSTAIVLRSLSERGELDAPHGRFIVGVLILQDLLVVPMVLVLPMLAGPPGRDTVLPLLGALAKAALVVTAIVLVSRKVVPRLFGYVDVTRSREIFLLAVLGLCIGTAWLTSLAGVSLALGAFLGGIVVADTEFKHRALSEVLPLRDAFASLFFVSLGMLFDWSALFERPLLFLALLAGFLAGKAAIATLAALVMGFPARVAWLSGLGLAQFGEFGFVLVRLGEGQGLLLTSFEHVLISAGVMSMFLTPLVLRGAPHFSAGEALLRPLERLLGARGIDEPEPKDEAARDHVIVAGYGVAGRLLADALAEVGVPHVVLELRAETVREARASGKTVYYADASSTEALRHAGIERAAMVVYLINDPDAARRAIAAARHAAPGVPVLVRAHYLGDVEALVAIGAAEAVAEEVEAGVEMLARVLHRFGFPRNVIHERVRNAREATQPSVRRPTTPRPRLGELDDLAEMKVEKILLRAGDHAVGRSALDLDLRSRTRSLLVAVRRGERILEDPVTALLAEGDLLYLVGDGEALRESLRLLGRGKTRAEQGDDSIA